jgi:hypothetical protein
VLVILDTTSSEEYNNENCDFAVVKIDTNEAKKLASLAKIFDEVKNTEESLTKMSFDPLDIGLKCGVYTNILTFNPMYKDTLPAEVKGVLEGELPFAVIPDDVEFPFCHAIEPENLELVIDNIGFSWTIYPQDSSIMVWTSYVPRDLLTRIV